MSHFIKREAKLNHGDKIPAGVKTNRNRTIKDALHNIKISEYIRVFKDICKEAYYSDFENMANFKDLRTLMNEPAQNSPIHYPKLYKDFQDKNGDENFLWFKIANKKRAYLPLANEDEGLIIYSLKN